MNEEDKIKNKIDVSKTEVVEAADFSGEQMASEEDVRVVLDEARQLVDDFLTSSNSLIEQSNGDETVTSELKEIKGEAKEALADLNTEIAQFENNENLSPEISKALQAVNFVFPKNLDDFDAVDPKQKEAHQDDINMLRQYLMTDRDKAIKTVLPNIENAFVRFEFLKEMVLEVANTDRQMAMDIFKTEVKKFGVTEEEVEVAVKDFDNETKEQDSRNKLTKIYSLMNSDVALAVKMWQENQDQNGYRWKYVEKDLEKAVLEKIDVLMKGSVIDVFDFCKNLPEFTPGLETAAKIIFYSKDHYLELEKLNILPKNLKSNLSEAVFKHFHKFIIRGVEKMSEYVKVLEDINSSPSQEIQRIAEQLFDQILNSDNLSETYKKIEDVFVKNNLPVVGKIYKIFEVLNPVRTLEWKLDFPNPSPYLKKLENSKRYATIFRDLLKIHIQSDNRSLRDFLEILQDGEKDLVKFEQNSDGNIRPQDLKKLKYFILKINTLFLNSQLEKNGDDLVLEEDLSLDEIKKSFNLLKESLQVKEGQSINERILELFAKPLGYQDISEVLSDMDKSRVSADKRSRMLAGKAVGGKLKIGSGDILKGVGGDYIHHILQNGSVAKEFLGGGSDSDSTPLDTDVDLLPKECDELGFKENIYTSLAQKYGDIVFVVKDRGQYSISTPNNVDEYDRTKFELYQTGFLGERHYGIRTGFPATEIDFFVLRSGSNNFKKLCSEIVQNGYYVPITNEDGEIIFTPEEYDEYRKFYNGLNKFSGGELDVLSTNREMKHYEDIRSLKDSIKQNSSEIKVISERISQVVESVLGEYGIVLKDKLDTSILGAELIDTGSTGRHTNMPGGFDFDLVLRLDDKDAEKVPDIVKVLKERLTPDSEGSSPGSGADSNIYQLRFFGSKNIDVNPVDIDIAFVKKSELVVYGSHDAVKEKLDWIKINKGDDVFEDVIANIILTKQILKKAEAYKKGTHEGGQGGLGGIGVENWILANGGNMIQAFKTFKAAAYNNGQRLGLEEFRKKYMLYDPGINMKFLQHDNFVHLLTESTYNKMVQIIDDYLEN